MWPRISPDGSRAAYSELRIGHYEHFLAPAGGGKLEVLCEDCGPTISDWSKDGKQVLIDFISQQRLISISLIKLDSHDRTQILQHSKYNLMQASSHPMSNRSHLSRGWIRDTRVLWSPRIRMNRNPRRPAGPL